MREYNDKRRADSRRIFYSPVREAVSQHLAVTCSRFLVKNPGLASNVNVSLHVGRSRDFIHETPRLLLESLSAMKYQKQETSGFAYTREFSFASAGDHLSLN